MCRIFVRGFCCRVGRIVNYVTRVAAKITDKKASEVGILINASSLTPTDRMRVSGAGEGVLFDSVVKLVAGDS